VVVVAEKWAFGKKAADFVVAGRRRVEEFGWGVVGMGSAVVKVGLVRKTVSTPPESDSDEQVGVAAWKIQAALLLAATDEPKELLPGRSWRYSSDQPCPSI
jgi:hypothetical protein